MSTSGRGIGKPAVDIGMRQGRKGRVLDPAEKAAPNPSAFLIRGTRIRIGPRHDLCRDERRQFCRYGFACTPAFGRVEALARGWLVAQLKLGPSGELGWGLGMGGSGRALRDGPHLKSEIWGTRLMEIRVDATLSHGELTVAWR